MKQVTAPELKDWLSGNKKFLLIDVREQFERDRFHIGGLHIPMGQLASRKQEIPQDQPVVIYCEKGIRSTIIIQRLEAAGFTNLYNLSGGLSCWQRD